MEVCGTHTVAIYRSGIANLLPKNLRLIAGPGCPVCVTSEADLYHFATLSREKGVILTSFGDLLRVPANGTSLEKERTKGGDIRIVYSPAEALTIAIKNPEKDVAFLGIGFETTAPVVAATVLEARRLNLKNFYLFSVLKRIPPVMERLLDLAKVKIDGYLCPGHVSVIIGSKPYSFIPTIYRRPAVIAGFQPEDILEGLLLILKQIKSNKPKVEIQYRGVVTPEGNKIAQSLINQVFVSAPASWRGLGILSDTGFKLKNEFLRFDGWYHFSIPEDDTIRPDLKCRCNEVIIGAIEPEECGQFRRRCTPEKPLGPCMVSSEGACAAHYKYARQNHS